MATKKLMYVAYIILATYCFAEEYKVKDVSIKSSVKTIQVNDSDLKSRSVSFEIKAPDNFDHRCTFDQLTTTM